MLFRSEDAIALARIQELNIQVLEKNALDMQAFHKCVEPIRSKTITEIPENLLNAYLGK